MRLLIIEDNVELCNMLENMFAKEQCALDISHDSLSGIDLAQMIDYSVIILDIMLPDVSGIDVLKRLRALGKATPIIMLTAKDTLDDKISAFNIGADDYLTKPFEFRELLARVRALERRSSELVDQTIMLGNTSIDRYCYEVKMNGKKVKTSKNESMVLECLFLNQGKFVSKAIILNIISGASKYIDSNNVEVYIHHLRKKFPESESGFTIETKKHFGYRVLGLERDV